MSKEIDKKSYYEIVSDESWSSDSNKENEIIIQEVSLKDSKCIKGKKIKGCAKEAQHVYVEKDKLVLIEKEKPYFDVLPEGWEEITHSSGMPLYLHRNTRVCTVSKPYSLGPESSKYHNIPISAIPCLSYRRAQEQEVAKQQEPITLKQEVSNIGGLQLPKEKIDTIQKNCKTHLTAKEVFEYCERLFKFKTIKIKKMKSSNGRRVYPQPWKEPEKPVLPEETKTVTVPIQKKEQPSSVAPPKIELVPKPINKNYITLLHEYVQETFKKTPNYKFVALKHDINPHMATVTINDGNYGIGIGPSKKIATNDAAKATLEILIPKMNEKTMSEDELLQSAPRELQDKDLSYFDKVKIEDPRVAELCAKVCEPSPYAMLETCLKRKKDEFGNTYIKCQWNFLDYQQIELNMTVGKHTATVICKDKNDGLNRAAQTILNAIHPNFINWGSILRIYGSKFVGRFTGRRMEEKSRKSKRPVPVPNYTVLNKLKSEMIKLKKSKTEAKLTDTDIDSDDEKTSSK